MPPSPHPDLDPASEPVGRALDRITNLLYRLEHPDRGRPTQIDYEEVKLHLHEAAARVDGDAHDRIEDVHTYLSDANDADTTRKTAFNLRRARNRLSAD